MTPPARPSGFLTTCLGAGIPAKSVPKLVPGAGITPEADPIVEKVYGFDERDRYLSIENNGLVAGTMDATPKPAFT
jgi:hypothetical protein